MSFWLGVLVGWMVFAPATLFIVLFFQAVSKHNRLAKLRDEYIVSDELLRRLTDMEDR